MDPNLQGKPVSVSLQFPSFAREPKIRNGPFTKHLYVSDSRLKVDKRFMSGILFINPPLGIVLNFSVEAKMERYRSIHAMSNFGNVFAHTMSEK